MSRTKRAKIQKVSLCGRSMTQTFSQKPDLFCSTTKHLGHHRFTTQKTTPNTFQAIIAEKAPGDDWRLAEASEAICFYLIKKGFKCGDFHWLAVKTGTQAPPSTSNHLGLQDPIVVIEVFKGLISPKLAYSTSLPQDIPSLWLRQ